VAAVIEQVWRYTWRPWLSEFGDMQLEAIMVRTCRPWSSESRDSLGGRDRVNLEMHSEIVIERVWRCSCEGRNQVSLEMHLEAVIEGVWRYALGGHDRVNLQAVIERVRRYTWRLWSSEVGWVLGGGRWTVRRDSIHQLVNSRPWECDKVTLPLKLLWRTGWWRSIGKEVRRCYGGA